MKTINIFLVSIAVLLILRDEVKSQNSNISNQEHLVMATIWFQQSPEMKALYHQGFNIAKMRLSEFAKHESPKPKAVVVDVDETMLDNSPYEVQQILDSHGFTSETWKEWTTLAKAKATPGAIDFSRFCDSLGIAVIYISNRKIDEVDATIRNLDSLGFAFAKKEYMIFKENVSSKKIRREKVSEKYNIVMLIGDNLNDLSEVFENREADWGISMVEKFKNEFGNRFIVLPNPMYGDWEKNIYGTARNLTEEKKRELRVKLLEGFRK